MGPFDIAALAIILGLAYKAFDSYNRQKTSHVADAELATLKQELESVKQRLASLETIVTDEGYQLKSQITQL